MNKSINHIFELVINPRLRVWQYILFCTVIFSMGLFYSLDSMSYRNLSESEFFFVLLVEASVHLFTIVTLVFHLLYWSHFLLIKGQIQLYAVGFFVLVWLEVVLESWINSYFGCDNHDSRYYTLYLIGNFINYGVFHIAAIGLKAFKMWILETKKRLSAESDAHIAQLEMLKSQLNPHFLFNTLNNLYVLNKTRPEEAGEVILRLSDLLRYQLYEGSGENVLMSKELEFIKTWLILEEIRRTKSHFNLTIIGDYNHLRLPPFLFMTFIENALKHGKIDSETLIKFTFKNDDFKHIIEFEVTNQKQVKIINSKTKVGGLGLKNVKQRLELLFKNNYHLKIEDSQNTFSVFLTLEIAK
ncbi:hypothetical protein DTQ70_13590 [Runella sp. SP2]|nr:hypothetical protein DTQ70_13590 [Runella sp. SP2]